jgi:hypothetical protein
MSPSVSYFHRSLHFLPNRMDNRNATAEWERQREREAFLFDKVEHIDDFTDTGTAQRYYQANRERILRHFGGTSEHAEGTYDWYTQWEKWARQQWEQQQRQQQQQQGSTQQQRQQQPRQQKSRPRSEYVWDFDPTDPYVSALFCYHTSVSSNDAHVPFLSYSVLGIRRGGSPSEVSAAFRKQMMYVQSACCFSVL